MNAKKAAAKRIRQLCSERKLAVNTLASIYVRESFYSDLDISSGVYSNLKYVL